MEERAAVMPLDLEERGVQGTRKSGSLIFNLAPRMEAVARPHLQ